MRHLWARLALAFTLVTLTSVVAAALLANQQAGADFRSFLAQSQIQESGLAADLADHYRASGGWAGVDALLAARRGMGAGRGAMRGAPALTLLDAGGAVVYDGGVAPGDPGVAAVPILVDGALAGTLLVRPAGQAGLSAAAERYLGQLNRALAQAGLAGALVGVLLGVLLARGIARPLDRLAEAARGLARGDLARRAPVGGPAEVADAARAFNEMAGALQEAEGLRRRMVADIAHELRTPLSVIQGSLQAILDDVYPLEKGEVQTILGEALLLARLVDDLRELALAEAGRLRLEPRPIDLAELVGRGAAAFQAGAAAKGVALHVEAAPGLPQALADPDRAHQVLRNLLANALRHTPPGGRVTVTTERAGGAVRVTVADTGEGIAPDDLPHVFERFWRADPARARGQGGTGLGLAIARQLVQAQGGEIGAASEPGRGSRFWFTLPGAPARP